MYRPDRDYWEMVTLMAIASGRKTALEAAKLADELLALRNNAFPPEERER
jgi:hypothetical protein